MYLSRREKNPKYKYVSKNLTQEIHKRSNLRKDGEDKYGRRNKERITRKRK